jgi:hypothetical protein
MKNVSYFLHFFKICKKYEIARLNNLVVKFKNIHSPSTICVSANATIRKKRRADNAVQIGPGRTDGC